MNTLRVLVLIEIRSWGELYRISEIDPESDNESDNEYDIQSESE